MGITETEIIALTDGGIVSLCPSGTHDLDVYWCTVINNAQGIFEMATLVERDSLSTDELKIVRNVTIVPSLRKFIEESLKGVNTQTVLKKLNIKPKAKNVETSK